MTIAVCSYCGGLVIIHATMCPHCGQRGEAAPSRRRVSRFGKRNKLPLPVRRMMIVAIVGTGAVFCLALANWMRDPVKNEINELAVVCQEIEAAGEEGPGMLNACKSQLATLRYQQRQ